MSETSIRQPAHRQVIALLSGLDSTLLARTQCWFGGGTRIVLELGEYRVSKDVDFLCSNREGYRLLRENVSETSLGGIIKSDLSLAREVRTDQYGIRTFIEIDETRVKFEIVREARIEVEGEAITGIPVDCLTRGHCFAEKFLANADRGMDASTLSRDIIDLAFMIEGWSKKDAEAGLLIAKSAYGDTVQHALTVVTAKMKEDKAYRSRCIEGLAITDTKTMTAGIRRLAAFK